MKKLLAAALIAATLPTLAIAKDVTITFNEQEQTAFIEVLDQATRGGGLKAASATVYFQNKFQQAVALASMPVPAAPAPAATKAE
jgi:hypothetical protein